MTDDNVEVDALHVGDEMLLSVALVDQLKADPRSKTVRVRVQKIVRRGDLYELWLENSRVVVDAHGNFR